MFHGLSQHHFLFSLLWRAHLTLGWMSFGQVTPCRGDIVPSCFDLEPLELRCEFHDHALSCMTQLQSKLLSCGFLSLVLLSTKCNTEVIHLISCPQYCPQSILPSTQRLFFICTVPGTVGDAECPWVKNL